MARIDDSFDVYRAEDLKRIAKRWGPNPPARTGDCIKFIQDALDNPCHARARSYGVEPLLSAIPRSTFSASANFSAAISS